MSSFLFSSKSSFVTNHNSNSNSNNNTNTRHDVHVNNSLIVIVTVLRGEPIPKSNLSSKLHPSYKTIFRVINDQSRSPMIDVGIHRYEVEKPFDFYRTLHELILSSSSSSSGPTPHKEVINILPKDFPPSHSSSKLGLTMSESDLQNRCVLLSKWIDTLFKDLSKYPRLTQDCILNHFNLLERIPTSQSFHMSKDDGIDLSRPPHIDLITSLLRDGHVWSSDELTLKSFRETMQSFSGVSDIVITSDNNATDISTVDPLKSEMPSPTSEVLINNGKDLKLSKSLKPGEVETEAGIDEQDMDIEDNMTEVSLTSTMSSAAYYQSREVHIRRNIYVKVEKGEKKTAFAGDLKSHPTFKTTIRPAVALNSSSLSESEGEGATTSTVSSGGSRTVVIMRFFKEYRTLHEALDEAGVTSRLEVADNALFLIKVPFPETFTRSLLGVQLTSTDLKKRCWMLHNWMVELLTLYPALPRPAKDLICIFLELTAEEGVSLLETERSKESIGITSSVLYPAPVQQQVIVAPPSSVSQSIRNIMTSKAQKIKSNKNNNSNSNSNVLEESITVPVDKPSVSDVVLEVMEGNASLKKEILIRNKISVCVRRAVSSSSNINNNNSNNITGRNGCYQVVLAAVSPRTLMSQTEKAVKDFLQLQELLAACGVSSDLNTRVLIRLKVPFPDLKSQSLFFNPTEREEEKKYLMLHFWMGEVISVFPALPTDVKYAVAAFVGVSVDALDLTDSDSDNDDAALCSLLQQQAEAASTVDSNGTGASVYSIEEVFVRDKIFALVAMGLTKPYIEGEAKEHPTYQTVVRIGLRRKNGKVETAEPLTTVSFFKDFRKLKQQLAETGVFSTNDSDAAPLSDPDGTMDSSVVLNQPFPESLVRSKLGLSLGLKGLKKRCWMLHNWIVELLINYPHLPGKAQELVCAFLGASHDMLEDSTLPVIEDPKPIKNGHTDKNAEDDDVQYIGEGTEEVPLGSAGCGCAVM